MSKNRSSRRNKKLSEEELREIEEFVYSKNQEEDKFLKSMSVNFRASAQAIYVLPVPGRPETIDISLFLIVSLNFP